MTRTNKYRAFRKELNVIVRKKSEMYCSPLGKVAVRGYRTYEKKYSMLSVKWMDWIDHKVHKAIVKHNSLGR